MKRWCNGPPAEIRINSPASFVRYVLGNISLIIFCFIFPTLTPAAPSLTYCLLTPVPPVTRVLAFVSLLTSSPLAKIDLICTQVLQKDKIFPTMPWSEWEAQWGLRIARKCSEIWLKNTEKNCLRLPVATPTERKICLSRWRFLRIFLNW